MGRFFANINDSVYGTIESLEPCTTKTSFSIKWLKVAGEILSSSLDTELIISHLLLCGQNALLKPFIIIAVLRQFQLSKLNHPLIQKNEFYKDKITAIILISYSLFTLILLYSDVYDMLIKS